MMPVPERDQRRFPRVALSIAAMIKAKDGIAIGRIENISLNGLYLLVLNDITLEVEELATVDIYLNDSDECRSILQVHGRIARMDEKGVGVQFRPMTLATHERLRAIINFMSGEESSSDDEKFLQFQLSNT